MYETLETHGCFDSRDPKVREAIDWADSVLPEAERDSTIFSRLFLNDSARFDFDDRWNKIPTSMNMPPYRSIHYGDFTGSSPVPTRYHISHPDMQRFNTGTFNGTNITDDSEGLVLRAANRQFRLRNMWFSEALLFTYAVHTQYTDLLWTEKLQGEVTPPNRAW